MNADNMKAMQKGESYRLEETIKKNEDDDEDYDQDEFEPAE